MIRNYFRVIYILIEKIVIGNTQPAHDVPETSPEGLLKVLKSEACRGLPGDSQGTNTKIDDFMKKKISEVIVLALLICKYITSLISVSVFLQEEQIFKSSKRVRPRDVYETQLRDVSETK